MRTRLLWTQVKQLNGIKLGVLILMLTPTLVLSQKIVLSGKVTDITGDELPGTNVILKGTTQGTSTDLNGEYSIAVEKGDTLIFSTTGFKKAQRTVGVGTTINVALEEEVSLMSEVVVVGYGTVKKSDLTGSVAKVDVDQLQKFASIDVRQNLQGSVAGVQVTSNSGAPGSGQNSIRIRGVGSFGNADPLFVVDGFITNDLSNITPSDITSVEVLKDASATAIYGSRGANGVIIVTTKQAQAGGITVDLNAYYGVQNVIKKYDLLDAKQYAKAYLISSYGEDGTIDDMGDGPRKDWISGVMDGTIEGTDWQEEVTRSAPIFNSEVSISGGTEKVAFKAGGVFFSQDGTLKNTFSERVQLNAGLRLKPHKKVSIDANIRYSENEFTRYNQGNYTGIMATAVRKDPIAAPLAPNSNFYDDSGLVDIGSPSLSSFIQKGDINNEKRINTNIKGTLELFKGVKFTSVFAHDKKKENQANLEPLYTTVNRFNRLGDGSYVVIPDASNDSIENWTNVNEITVLQSSNYFNFVKEIKKHTLGLDIGTEYYRNSFEQTPGREILQARPTAFTLLSFFGRASYNFVDRYLATVTLRRDGSSKLAKANRWGNFPSFSLAWNVDRESFFPTNTTFLAGLKLRGGWGQIGNQDPISPYGFSSQLETGQVYSFDNQTGSEGLAADQLPAATLRWEISEMVNFGTDIYLADNKVEMTVEYFVKNTKDLLVETLPTPNFVGALGPRSNVASMRNKGLELALSYKQSFGELDIDVGGNITFIDNVVTGLGALEGETVDYIAGGEEEGKINLPATRTKVGEEFATFYGYKILGVFQSDEEANAHRAVNASGIPIDKQGNVLTDVDPTTFIGKNSDGEDAEQALLQRKTAAGDFKYQDANFDGKINEEDAVALGSAIPDFTYGGYISASYKGIDFNLTISGVHGNEAANIFKYYTEGQSATFGNITVDRFENRWTPENGSNTTPRLSTSAASTNDDFSERYVEDASFMRIRNVQLGYNFPNSVLEKLKLQKLRIYLSADNVATFTQYSGLDPEVGGRNSDSFSPGVDYFNYPQARTIFFGTNITF